MVRVWCMILKKILSRPLQVDGAEWYLPVISKLNLPPHQKWPLKVDDFKKTGYCSWAAKEFLPFVQKRSPSYKIAFVCTLVVF